MKSRNNNIDFFRGIAVISVLFIHTVFKSGDAYVPNYICNLSLLIDVPLFVFIAGYAFSFSMSYFKSIKGILLLYTRYVFFIVLIVIGMLIYNRQLVTVDGFIGWLFFNFSPSFPLTVISSSTWFMPMFIKITLLCPAIICVVKKNYNNSYINKMVTVFGLLVFLYLFGRYNSFYIDSQVLQYSVFYILGLLSSKIKISSFKSFLLLEITVMIGLLLLYRYTGNGLLDMQRLKFEYSAIYLVYSLIFIIFIWYINDRMNISNNLFCWIGKNAIWFYFSQGVSSSICYSIVPIFTGFKWYITLPIVFIANFVLSLFISWMIIKIYNFLTSKLECKKYGIFSLK